MWVYRSGEFAAPPAVIFDYQPSRSGRCVADFLGDYAGYLLTDGYATYDTLKSVRHAGCMANARRKFTETQKVQPGKKAGCAEQGTTAMTTGKSDTDSERLPRLADRSQPDGVTEKCHRHRDHVCPEPMAEADCLSGRQSYQY